MHALRRPPDPHRGHRHRNPSDGRFAKVWRFPSGTFAAHLDPQIEHLIDQIERKRTHKSTVLIFRLRDFLPGPPRTTTSGPHELVVRPRDPHRRWVGADEPEHWSVGRLVRADVLSTADHCLGAAATSSGFHVTNPIDAADR